MACGRRRGFDTALCVGIAIPAFNLRRHSVHQALVDGHDLVGLEGLSGSVPSCGDTVGHIPQFVAVTHEHTDSGGQGRRRRVGAEKAAAFWDRFAQGRIAVDRG